MSHSNKTVHDHPVNAMAGEKLAIVVEGSARSGPIGSMEERYKALDNALDDKANHQKPRIQRIPITLLANNVSEECYEPRLVSIGPIHHGKPKYQVAEKFKLKLAALFIKRCGQPKEVLFHKIRGKIKELRECFDEDVIKGYQNDDLAWLLLVDGCAVLHHMYCMDNESEYGKMKVKADNIVFVQRDLFLLENQIPFEVLKLLVESDTNKNSDWQQTIENFVSRNTMEPFKKQGTQQDILGAESPTHLLDLLRTRILGPKRNGSKTVKKGVNGILKSVFEHGKTIDDWHSFRNIKELREAGIHLTSSKTSYLKDISFGSHIFACLCLHLPPIIVDDSTKSKFLNLIAYEMCPDFQNDFEVTSYVCFLDTLIDHPSDVKELRSARVLYNLLGSDKEVATLFNNLSTGLVPNPEMYIDVKRKIEQHCSNRVNTWTVQIYYIYFSTPWAILGFLGALLALFLTSVQAWYAAFGPKGS